MQSLMTIKISKFNFWKLGILAIGLVGTIAIAYIIFRPQPTPEINIETDTVLVKSQDLQLQIKVNGLVQSIRKINISPSTQGRIMELFVREGDRIQAGQSIARMDDEQLQAQVSQYEAILDRSQAQLAERLAGSRQEEVAKAEADVIRSEARVQEARSRLQLDKEKLNRRQILQKEGAITREALNESQVDVRNAEDNLTQTQASLAISQQDLARQRSGFRAEEIAQTRAQVAEANAQLQSFQIQLNNTLVRAPFDGIITRCFTDVGDFVAPTTSASSSDGATSASIAELSSGLEVEAKVPEANIAGIKQGQSVEVRSDSYPDQVFKGQVQSIAPRAVKENSITSFRVKVKLETGLEQLKAGMNVKLAFIAEPIQNALVVPLSAVVTQKDGQRGIWLLVANRKIRFQLIRLGSENGSQAQILEGLKAGDRILISPPANQIIPGVDNTQGTGM